MRCGALVYLCGRNDLRVLASWRLHTWSLMPRDSVGAWVVRLRRVRLRRVSLWWSGWLRRARMGWGRLLWCDNRLWRNRLLELSRRLPIAGVVLTAMLRRRIVGRHARRIESADHR